MMFNWLKRKDELDAEWLPKPTRPAPQMSECKPYSVPYVPPNGIGEPVLTLLEMLKRDEWEVQRVWEVSGETWKVINIYNEQVVFYMSRDVYPKYNLVSRAVDMPESWWLLDNEWMTLPEKDRVILALRGVIKGVNKINREDKLVYSRKAFAKLINVEETC